MVISQMSLVHSSGFMSRLEVTREIELSTSPTVTSQQSSYMNVWVWCGVLYAFYWVYFYSDLEFLVFDTDVLFQVESAVMVFDIRALWRSALQCQKPEILNQNKNKPSKMHGESKRVWKDGCELLVNNCVCVCLCLGSSWGWSIVDDRNSSLPYICEIPKTDIYKIVRITRGYGNSDCVMLIFSSVTLDSHNSFV